MVNNEDIRQQQIQHAAALLSAAANLLAAAGTSGPCDNIPTNNTDIQNLVNNVGFLLTSDNTTVATETKNQEEKLAGKDGFYLFYVRGLNDLDDFISRGFMTKNIFRDALKDGFNLRLEHLNYNIDSKSNTITRIYLNNVVCQNFFATAAVGSNVMGILYRLAAHCEFIKASNTLYEELVSMNLPFDEPFTLEKLLKSMFLKCRLSKATTIENYIMKSVSSRLPSCLSPFMKKLNLNEIRGMTITKFCLQLENHLFRNDPIRKRVTQELSGYAPTTCAERVVGDGHVKVQKNFKRAHMEFVQMNGVTGKSSIRGGKKNSGRSHPYNDTKADRGNNCGDKSSRDEKCYSCGQYGLNSEDIKEISWLNLSGWRYLSCESCLENSK
ncbi:unnamed protein product [Ambrosiozyma monospora]|uniref:Unnamed protein product n=1 Tax=Ambrosiozyma monospora TaxID=43982 RepID=A0ACB5T0R5_AMBMO|nr:unnamed protein product [Ambrosiozyma monospora]